MGSIMLLVIVFVLDLIAFSFAIAAELRLSHAKVMDDLEDEDLSYCKYDKDVVKTLGIGAFLFLLASHLLIMFASRCLCCGSGLRPGVSRSCAVFLFITSWVLFFVAEACLLAGSVENAYHTKFTGNFENPISCQALRKGVFAAGAAFVVVTGIISETFYVYYSKSSSYNNNPTNRGDTGVMMSNL